MLSASEVVSKKTNSSLKMDGFGCVMVSRKHNKFLEKGMVKNCLSENKPFANEARAEFIRLGRKRSFYK
jgi:hypothetical protein